MGRQILLQPFSSIQKYCNKEGSIFLLILATILVVTILSSVLFNIVNSHSRLSHHQISRIQAYYAAQAGINYALEKLRVGNDAFCWPAAGAYTRLICRGGCSGCNINDAALPTSIKQVSINVGTPDSNGIRKISATTDFTYTAP